jgi:predicted ATPase with chaperone activity
MVRSVSKIKLYQKRNSGPLLVRFGIPTDRFDGSQMRTNADKRAKEVQHFCELDGAGETQIRAAMKQLHFPARSYHRGLKL